MPGLAEWRVGPHGYVHGWIKVDGPERGKQLAAMDPGTRALALAQEDARKYNPGMVKQLGTPDEASGILQNWLSGSGIRMADSAYVTRHPNPAGGTSNSGRGPDGEPMVALHPDRWDYGTLAHEAAHLLHQQEGRPEGQEHVHGPEFVKHYARLLNRVSRGAGDDLTAAYAAHGGTATRTAKTAEASTVHEPVGNPAGPGLWHHKGMQLPAYIQHVANRLREQGHSESNAVQMAVGIIKNWAAGHDGHGNRVHADVQAAAVKAVAQWEALKAAASGGKGRSASMAHSEFRAAMAAADMNDLPDDAFAYIEPGGTKDSSGKTVPRSLRHFPVHDEAHVRNALSRAPQSPFGEKAMPKIRAAAQKMGIHMAGMADSGRSLPGHPVERRYTPSIVGVMLIGGEESRDGVPRRIGGYAAKFSTYSRDLPGGFVEQVHPHFFNKSKGDGWPGVICRFNHDTAQLLGTVEGRTLTLNTDRDGLIYEVEPPRHMQHIVEYVERGDIRKSSFAFRCYEDDWSWTSDGGPLRTLITGATVDVAPVVDPAYVDTTAGLRSFADHFDADYEEVRSMAEAHELRKFFKRSDGGLIPAKPPEPLPTATEAMLKLMERRFDPYIDGI